MLLESSAQKPEQRDMIAFARTVFPGYKTSDHIFQLVEAITWAVNTPDARLIVTMPPRHSKSMNVSEILPAWYLGLFPDKRIIAASHSQRLANKFSRKTRNLIKSKKYPFENVVASLAREMGQKSSSADAVEMWDIEGHRGGYIAVGRGGSPTGDGADLMIIDDPIRNQADANSEVVRESLWDWYTGTMRTRLEPGASIIVTSTRWHEDDLTGRLLAAEKQGGELWRHVYMPAIDDNGNALWPGRWPVAALEKIRAGVGERVWLAQYQGRPTTQGGDIFQLAWWRRYRSGELPVLERVELFCDSAFKTGVANDWTVFSLWGKSKDERAYLLRVWRVKLRFPDLIKAGHEHYRFAYRYGEPVLCVEDKASGQSAIDVWSQPYYTGEEEYPALSVVPIPVKSTDSKESRAEAVTPFIEGGRVFVPENAPWLDAWIDEHTSFPYGKHDDQVDTTSMALARLLGGKATGWDDQMTEDLVNFLYEYTG